MSDLYIKILLVVIWNWCVTAVIVKATNGPRYVVGCRRQLDKTKLKAGTRVALDMTTLTIMRLVARYLCGSVINSVGELAVRKKS